MQRMLPVTGQYNRLQLSPNVKCVFLHIMVVKSLFFRCLGDLLSALSGGVLQLDSPWGAKYVARAFPCDVCKAAKAGFTTMSDDKDRASLEELETKLSAVAHKREEKHSPNRATGKPSQGMAIGMRISAEMIAAVLVGLLIGWALDRVLDSTPWLIVLFVFLGAGAGGLNAYRVAKGYDSAVGLGRAMRERSKQGDED